MKAVAVKELKNRLSHYLREVASGEIVLVTDRGRVVAELHRPPTERADYDSFPSSHWHLRGCSSSACPRIRERTAGAGPRCAVPGQALLDAERAASPERLCRDERRPPLALQRAARGGDPPGASRVAEGHLLPPDAHRESSGDPASGRPRGSRRGRCRRGAGHLGPGRGPVGRARALAPGGIPRRAGVPGRARADSRCCPLASVLLLRHSVPDLVVLSTDARVRENASQLGFELFPPP